jgi:hypothetical protein
MKANRLVLAIAALMAIIQSFNAGAEVAMPEVTGVAVATGDEITCTIEVCNVTPSPVFLVLTHKPIIITVPRYLVWVVV